MKLNWTSCIKKIKKQDKVEVSCLNGIAGLDTFLEAYGRKEFLYKFLDNLLYVTTEIPIWTPMPAHYNAKEQTVYMGWNLRARKKRSSASGLYVIKPVTKNSDYEIGLGYKQGEGAIYPVMSFGVKMTVDKSPKVTYYLNCMGYEIKSKNMLALIKRVWHPNGKKD